MTSETVDFFREALRQCTATLPGNELPWLRNAREGAIEQFVSLGWPNAQQEDWKYTDVSPIAAPPWHFVPQDVGAIGDDDLRRLVDALVPDPVDHYLVFVNGRHVPRLSKLGRLPRGVFAGSLAQALREMPERLEPFLAPRTYPDAFAALNAAFFADGFVVLLPPGEVVDKPLHVLFLTGEKDLAVQPFNVVLAGARSGWAIIEQYAGLSDEVYWTNAFTQVLADEEAHVQHYRLQQEGLKAFHLASVCAAQQRASSLVSHAFAFGGALSRTFICTSLDAEKAQTTLNGLYFVGARQHVDHHTRIDHVAPCGTSREYYRGVLDGAARGVFNGRVIVHPGAQHTDAHQANYNLLLSRNAEIDTKPQLEIYADDVKCTHGATVGQLDEDQLFYLRTRGVDERMARAVLTCAFARDIIERVQVRSLRERLESLLLERTPEGERIRELS